MVTISSSAVVLSWRAAAGSFVTQTAVLRQQLGGLLLLLLHEMVIRRHASSSMAYIILAGFLVGFSCHCSKLLLSILSWLQQQLQGSVYKFKGVINRGSAALCPALNRCLLYKLCMSRRCQEYRISKSS
jgi:hypothetical protein